MEFVCRGFHKKKTPPSSHVEGFIGMEFALWDDSLIYQCQLTFRIIKRDQLELILTGVVYILYNVHHNSYLESSVILWKSLKPHSTFGGVALKNKGMKNKKQKKSFLITFTVIRQPN